MNGANFVVKNENGDVISKAYLTHGYPCYLEYIRDCVSNKKINADNIAIEFHNIIKHKNNTQTTYIQRNFSITGLMCYFDEINEIV